MLSSSDGTHPSSIRTHRATPPGPTRQCKPFEPAGAQRHPVCRRTWLQMARVTGEIWQLAHHLHSDEPLVEERGAGPGVRTPATRAGLKDHPRRDEVADEIERTFSLSPGQAHDAPEGRKLLNRLGQQHDTLIMRAYEGDETRQLALALGYEPVVPPLRTRVVDPHAGQARRRETRPGSAQVGRGIPGTAGSAPAARAEQGAQHLAAGAKIHARADEALASVEGVWRRGTPVDVRDRAGVFHTARHVAYCARTTVPEDEEMALYRALVAGLADR